jgi:DNA helicase-2/ATP-dependent DNA helicase PcrA
MQANLESFIGLRKQIMKNEFSRMNEMQREAVFSVEGPLLILAGAGSGKTTVLVNRIACIIKYGNAFCSKEIPFSVTDEDIEFLKKYICDESTSEEDKSRVARLLAVKPSPAWSILAITFTNKAAGELKERLEKMLGSAGNDVWASTFHSACVRILRRNIDKLGQNYTNNFTVYDSDDSIRLIKDCMKQCNVDDKKLLPKAIQHTIGRAKDQLTTAEEFELQAGQDFRNKEIAKVYSLYQKRLRTSNSLDFDDIIMLTVKLLEQCDDVRDTYHKRFKYILVDEYQDTNFAQFRLVNLLAQGSKNLCVVGDDDQSIYKFRGATIENIMNFEKVYPNAKVIKLEQNYRSTKMILDAANSVITNNINRKGKELWTASDVGEKIAVYCGGDERDEALFVANTILQNSVTNNCKFKEHAILYRSNAQSNILESTLVKMGIPYRIIGGHRFYERKEIKDVIAYLSIINNPNDDIRLKRVINEPKRQIGNATIEILEALANSEGKSIYEILINADEYDVLAKALSKLRVFIELVKELRVLSETLTLHELYSQMLNKSGYMNMLVLEKTEDSKNRIENLEELSSNIQKYEEENEFATLSGFLEEVSLMTDLDNYDANADAVVMMTMHAAKGLEFHYVFITGMEEGVFPGRQAIFEPGEIEEERRLAYVGITRAMKKLYLTHASSRMLYGSTQYNILSRFAKEIPDIYKEFLNVKEKKKVTAAPFKKAENFKGLSDLGISQQEVLSKKSYKAGETVKHKAFGEGMIISTRAMGGDVLLEIAFDKIGTKKVMANYVKLEKI